MVKCCVIGLTLFLGISLEVFSQSYTSYFTGSNSDTVTRSHGGICIMGGATEDDEAMKWFLNRCSGGDVLVLRASGADGYNNYLYKELGVHVHSVETIVCNNRAASGETYIMEKIKHAEGIWFAGGDQWDYVSYWRNTAIDSLVNEAILKRNVVVGGTSAGMAIQGGFYFSARHGTVSSLEALSNPYNTKVTVDSAGFIKNRFLQDVITDTHYDNPDRRGRQVAFMARIVTDWGAQAKGLACDEYAAMCIDTAGIVRCFGDYPKSKDYLYFIQANCELADGRPEDCSPGHPLEWNRDGQALKVYKLFGTPGGENTFNLNDWKTGTGGSWEHWYVEKGYLFMQQGSGPDCDKPVGLITTVKNGSITAYPNPNSVGDVCIESQCDEIINVSITDMYGKIIRFFPGGKMETVHISVSDLPAGIYVFTCETGRVTKQIKVILN